MASSYNIYKKFYEISVVSGNTSYTLTDPYSLSANTYVSSTGSTYNASQIIESGVGVAQDSTGIWYAVLNPKLYAQDYTYDLVWFVTYVSGNSSQKLMNRFRINYNAVFNQMQIEVFGSYT